MPNLPEPSFANRFGYDVIVVSNICRARAISDTKLNAYQEMNAALEGTSSSESSESMRLYHPAPQPEMPQENSSKLNRLKAIAMTKCIIS